MQAQVALNEMRENCANIAQIMKALAHPQRLMLLCHLSTGEKTVGELEELCGISQSQVSQFLARLKLEGIVASKKRGLFVAYEIADKKVTVLISALHRIYC